MRNLSIILHLLAYLVLLLALSRPPDMAGTMTWYAAIGALTRSELAFEEDAVSFAVDTAVWPSFACGPRLGVACRRLLVCGQAGCAVGSVLDTGYLARAGVVLDGTPRAFREVCGELEIGVCEVRGWKIPS